MTDDDYLEGFSTCEIVLHHILRHNFDPRPETENQLERDENE